MPPGRSAASRHFPWSPKAEPIRWGGGGSVAEFFPVAAERVPKFESTLRQRFWKIQQKKEFLRMKSINHQFIGENKHLPTVWGTMAPVATPLPNVNALSTALRAVIVRALRQ